MVFSLLAVLEETLRLPNLTSARAGAFWTAGPLEAILVLVGEDTVIVKSVFLVILAMSFGEGCCAVLLGLDRVLIALEAKGGNGVLLRRLCLTFLGVGGARLKGFIGGGVVGMLLAP